MYKRSVRLAAGLALALASGAAISQTTSSTPTRSWLPLTSYGYVGGNIGQSDFDVSCVGGFGCERTDPAFKLYTGGQLWRFIGLELGYVNVGKAEVAGGSLKAQGVNLSLVANLPLGPVNVFGKLGSTYGFTKTTAAAPGVSTGRDRGFGMSYGAGVGFDITRSWQVRGEWDRYRFDFKGTDNDVDMYSIGVAYKF